MLFKPKKSNESFTALGLVGSFGFLLGGTTFIGYLIGSFLDKHLNTSPWLLLTCVLLGITSGFIEIFKTIKKISK